MKFYTAEEAAEILREKVENTRRRCAKGQIRAKRSGRQWLISEDALTEYMSGPPTRSPRKRLTRRQRQQLGQAS